MDLGAVAAVGAFGVTIATVVYSAGKMNGKMDVHSAQMNQRMDRQDIKLDETVTTLTGVQIDIGKIKGKIGMNGH